MKLFLLFKTLSNAYSPLHFFLATTIIILSKNQKFNRGLAVNILLALYCNCTKISAYTRERFHLRSPLFFSKINTYSSRDIITSRILCPFLMRKSNKQHIVLHSSPFYLNSCIKMTERHEEGQGLGREAMNTVLEAAVRHRLRARPRSVNGFHTSLCFSNCHT